VVNRFKADKTTAQLKRAAWECLYIEDACGFFSIRRFEVKRFQAFHIPDV